MLKIKLCLLVIDVIPVQLRYYIKFIYSCTTSSGTYGIMCVSVCVKNYIMIQLPNDRVNLVLNTLPSVTGIIKLIILRSILCIYWGRKVFENELIHIQMRKNS